MVNSSTSINVEITNEFVLKCIQNNLALYDKSGEQHYDIISAFIKSIRGSDPNGAVYWLARMIEGGEIEFVVVGRREEFINPVPGQRVDVTVGGLVLEAEIDE